MKPYLNSNKNPVGLTLNGKSKEYIEAHKSFTKLLIRGKKLHFYKGKLTILDVSNTPLQATATVEVDEDGGVRGNVQVKVYIPSTNKKKGATIKLRKLSDFDYSFVEKLKNVIHGYS